MITTWSKDEPRRIAEADDLHISPFREDGVTYGTPTWIWSVSAKRALLRAYNGPKSRWYQTALRQKAGRIIAGGMTKEVTFEPVDGPIDDCLPGEISMTDRPAKHTAARSKGLRQQCTKRPPRAHCLMGQDHRKVTRFSLLLSPITRHNLRSEHLKRGGWSMGEAYSSRNPRQFTGLRTEH